MADNFDLSISCEVFVPREIVYELWTEQEHLEQWHPPCAGSDATVTETVRPEKLVYTMAQTHDTGPAGEVRVVFEDLGGRTGISVHQTALVSADARERQRGAWGLALDRLTDYLSII